MRAIFLEIRGTKKPVRSGGLLGPSLGGILLASAGLPATMVVNLLLCACAAGAAWWLGAPDRQAAAKPRRGWFADMADGLRAKWQVRLDRWWTLSGALMMACLLPATGLLVPLRIQGLGLSAGWFGACNAALSAGLLVGIGGVAPWLTARIGRVGAIAVALAGCAAAMAGTGLLDGAPWLVAMFALIGLCLSVTQLIGQTHRMLAMPEDYRARMNAANILVAHLVASVAPAIAALLLRHMGIGHAYLLLSAVFAAGGVLMLAIPGLAAFLRQDHQAVHGWYGRQYPEAFMR